MLNRPDVFSSFTPSPETIKRCLLTRKSDIKIGTAVKPGLIGCDDFGWDSLFFAIAVALEIIGLGAILMNRLPLVYALSGMLFALIADLVLAIWLHSLVSGKTVLLRAEKIEAQAGLGNFTERSQEQRNAWVIENERRIRLRHWVALVPASGIVLFCFAKIVAYVGLNSYRVDTGLFLLVASYAVVAYIHLTRTGYWIAAVIAFWYWKRDIRNHQMTRLDKAGDEIGVANHQEFVLNTEGLRTDVPPRISRAGQVVHEVVTLAPFEKMPDGSTKPGRYELRCRGVLMDDEIRELLNFVALGANQVREAIALRCMVYQLNLIHTSKEGA